MKIFFALLLLLIETTCVAAVENSTQERDSILARIDAIENDSARLKFELAMQYKYILSPFARELVDKFYEDAQKVGDRQMEMIALCSYFSMAHAAFDIKGVEKSLKNIEIHAQKYNLYDYFYRYKRSYLSLMASNGNIEWALIEAEKMKVEAQNRKHQLGVISAKLAIVQAYKFTRNDKLVIKNLQEILSMNTIEDNEKYYIYLNLYTSFHNLQRYKEGIKYLDLQKELLENKFATKPAYQSRQMHNETLYADAYMALENYSKAEEHLKKAEKYYTPTTYLVYYAIYHSVSARYYAHLKKWDLCFDRMDSAINCLGKEQLILKESMIARKSKYLEDAGKFRETVRSYHELLFITDSLNQVFIQKQEEALAENYRLEHGLEKKAQYAYILSLISIIFVILLLIGTIWFVLQLYRSHIQLQKAKKEAENAENEAVESVRFRKALLNNISKEIEAPIRRIKKITEGIAMDNPTLDNSLIQTVETEATNLIQLLDLVVEFSKLEVGAIKFNISQTDILAICYESIDRIKQYPENKVEIHFTPKIEIQSMELDRDWMLFCLTSTMLDLADSLIPNKISITIKYSNDAQMVIFEIIGSPLANSLFLGQIQTLKNQINNLLIQSFWGVYTIQMSELHPILTISLPIIDTHFITGKE